MEDFININEFLERNGMTMDDLKCLVDEYDIFPEKKKKFKNISEYCAASCISVYEMREYLFDAVMTLSTNATHVLTNGNIEQITTVFHYFNEILESVE